jgi:hypothetical protein
LLFVSDPLQDAAAVCHVRKNAAQARPATERYHARACRIDCNSGLRCVVFRLLQIEIIPGTGLYA